MHEANSSSLEQRSPNAEPPHTKNSPLSLRSVRDWDDLRVFVETIRAGSLGRAARALKLQQPTVSRRLRRLEDNLGVRLLDRGNQGATPTQDGLALYAYIEDFAHAATQGIKGFPGGGDARRDVKVRMTEGLAAYWMAHLIPDMAAEFPHLRLKLATAAYSQEPKQSLHDFEVSFAFPENMGLRIKRLGTLHFVPMASRDYLAIHGAPSGKFDVPRHRLLENALISSKHGSWSQLLGVDGVEANVVAVLNSMNAYAEFVLAGAGIGLMPTYLMDVRPNLVRVDLNVHIMWPFHLIRQEGRGPDPDLDRFQSWLEAQFDRRRYPHFANYTE